MSKTSIRYKKRKNAQEVIRNIVESQAEYLVIHYSCESFFDLTDGNTPRITSIAVRYLKNGQTKSFSIHKVAELNGVLLTDINKNYDKFEKEMLDDYYNFVSNHLDFKWIHINMRNINYGFEAIDHRYKVLGGVPQTINDNCKIDLARIMVDLFGKNYSPHPRFEKLYRMNKMTMTDFMNGKQEAKAFRDGEYVLLHRSTLRKVDNIHNIINLVYENDIKTKNNIIKIYGLTPSGLFYSAKENWLIALLIFLCGTLFTYFLSKLLN